MLYTNVHNIYLMCSTEDCLVKERELGSHAYIHYEHLKQ
jgi:hypothetical protein